MIINPKRTLILSCMLFSVLALSPLSAQTTIPRSVLGSGGGTTSNTNHRLVGTLGQPLVGKATGSSIVLESGFWRLSATLITGVEEAPAELPTDYRLDQNFPNPFNPQTTIQFALPRTSSVRLKIYDMLGRELATLVDEELPAGVHKVVFDAKALPSGVYFYRIQAEQFVRMKKLLLVK